MGLLPELQRAWLSVDNRLFLWRIQESQDLYIYEGLEQLIVSVSLVRARPGFFVDEISWLLVVATPVEILLLAVRLGRAGELALLPTQLAIPSDNVAMLRAVGTRQGRIFLAGKDGNLYELEYGGESGWFAALRGSGEPRRKLRKLKLTGSTLATLVPSWMRAPFQGADEPLLELALDQERQLLYTLSSTNRIEVFDLGADGQAPPVRVASRSGAELSREIANSVPAQGPGAQAATQPLQLVSLHVVPQAESLVVHLVAVSSLGLRLYFTTQRYPTAASTSRPNSLDILHVRLPPASAVPPAGGAGAVGAVVGAGQPLEGVRQVQAAFYGEGLLLLADARQEERDVLLACSLDLAQLASSEGALPSMSSSGAYGLYYTYRQRGIVERMQALQAPIAGRTWALTEVSPPSQTLRELLPTPPPPSSAHELLYSHLLGPRELLALSSGGLSVLRKLRPVDVLYQLLLQSAGRDSDALQSFFDAHGADQAAAMCLTIACARQPSLLFGPADRAAFPEPQVAAWAERAFFRYGGSPSFPVPAPAPAPVAPLPSTALDIQYSAAHQGLCIYASRLLRPFWTLPLAQGTETLQMRPRPQQLAQLTEQLAALHDFLRRNPAFTASAEVLAERERSEGGSMRARVLDLHRLKKADEARKIEARSLQSMQHLLVRALEAAAFASLLHEYGFPELAAQLAPEARQRLVALRFRDLVQANPDAVELARQLGSLAVQRAGQPAVDLLSQRCPSFFSSADHARFQAEELLQRADRAHDDRERREALQAATRLLLRAPLQLKLPEVAWRLRFHRHYQGLAELVLAWARELDPGNLALAYYRDPSGAGPEASQARRLYEARVDAYALLLACLDEIVAPQQAPQVPPPPAPGTLPAATAAGTAAAAAAAVPVRPRPPLEDPARARDELMRSVLSSQDELAQVSLFQWHIEREQAGELLQIASPYLESFLRQRHELDLLWKYYAQQNKPEAASEVLRFVAELPRQELTDEIRRALRMPPGATTLDLETRLAYLSRALAQARAAGRPTLVAELEERLEVGQIQMQILSQLRASAAGDEARRQAARELEQELLDLSALYNRYARRFQLWEACLAILHSASHQDPALVRRIWDELIQAELRQPSDHRLSALRQKLLQLARLYRQSEVVFPLAAIVELLERHSLRLPRDERARLGDAWVLETLLEAGVGHQALFDAYNGLVDGRLTGAETTWVTEPTARLHLLRILYELLRRWRLEDPRGYETRRLALDNAREKYILALQALPDKDLLFRFRALQ